MNIEVGDRQFQWHIINNSQIMNKNEFDTLSTMQDGSKSNVNSFQCSELLSTSRMEKVDQATTTDQLICNCACEMIPKLKQKAHRAFMQVVEIENLYKQELDQLKDYYEQRQKSQNKKFTYKENMLEEKCKELEQQVEKLKEDYHRGKMHNYVEDLQSPFIVDSSIDSIMHNPTPDDSCESIYQNMKEFITTSNLVESSQKLKNTISKLLDGLEKKLMNDSNSPSDSDVNQRQASHMVQQIKEQVQKIFKFVSEMIDNTVNAGEKFNQMARGASQLEIRYNKIYGVYQSSQKETKFMSDHIKRLSQDNLMLKRRYNELQRNNKTLQESCKALKKNLSDKGALTQSVPHPRKQIDIFSTRHIGHEDQLDISKSSLASCRMKKSPGANKVQQLEKPLPLSLNFKKKGAGRSQEKS